jgi:hypothetical protein
MIADSHAMALDTGLDTAIVFADMAPDGCLRPYYEKLCANVVDKAFGARPGTQAK